MRSGLLRAKEHSALADQAFFARSFASTLNEVGKVLPEALQALQEGGWIEPSQVFYARLCLEEALVNAVVHGNHGDATLGVSVELIDEGEERCCIRVYDEGGGFSPEQVETPDCCNGGGRGIVLIRHCMDSVTYNTAERCLEMRMKRKALCKGGATHV